jgi:hypothetical protein
VNDLLTNGTITTAQKNEIQNLILAETITHNFDNFRLKKKFNITEQPQDPYNNSVPSTALSDYSVA